MAITPDQCRAARTMLHWTQPMLSEAVGIARATIANFERGASTPHAGNLASLQAALEAAGIIFIEEDKTAGPGVRLRK